MTSTLETSRTSAGPLSIEDVRQFLFPEARALDDKDWDAWLACYAPDAEFWMPSWDDDDKLVTDPQSEISLIYYAHRAGWRTASSASGPSGRAPPACRSRGRPTTSATSRSSSKAAETVGLRFNWVTFSFRYKTVDTYFGTSFYTLDTSGDTAADQDARRSS